MRIMVREAGDAVEVVVEGHLLRRLWVPTSGGYVREVSRQQGAFGQQVAEDLRPLGYRVSMAHLPSSDHLLAWARRQCRRQAVRAMLQQEVEGRLDSRP